MNKGAFVIATVEEFRTTINTAGGVVPMPATVLENMDYPTRQVLIKHLKAANSGWELSNRSRGERGYAWDQFSSGRWRLMIEAPYYRRGRTGFGERIPHRDRKWKVKMWTLDAKET